MTGVAVPLLQALLDELLDPVLMLEQEPMEQQEDAEEDDELDEEWPLEEAGLKRLRSLLGLLTPSL